VHSTLSYIVVAGVGLLLAHFLTRSPDLSRLRLLQLVFVPVAFVAAWAVLPDPSGGPASIGSLMAFFVILGFLAISIAPNIAHHFGAALSNFLDPVDWTPAEEELALRPIVKLIDKDRYQDAFAELEELLKKHKPTFEALHLRAKLLNHFQRFDETIATLLQMIRFSHTTHQQLVVMELLAGLDARQASPSKPPAPGARQIRISHELLLFNPGAADRSVHKTIPPGDYQVDEILSGRNRWLVLKDDAWGNAEACWEAVEDTGQPAQSPARTGFLYQIVRAQQTLISEIKGKPRRQSREESRALHKEASQWIRQGDWARALPLLQKASAGDPDNYEIAYRLVQAAHQVGAPSNSAAILRNVLAQSHWTEDEERMLKQFKS